MHYTFIDIPERCISIPNTDLSCKSIVTFNLKKCYSENVSFCAIHVHYMLALIILSQTRIKAQLLTQAGKVTHSIHHTFQTPSKIPHSYLIPNLLRRLPIYESQSLLSTHSINTTRLVMERNTIALIRHEQHLRSESRADKLSTHTARTSICILGTLLGGDFLEHLCYSCAVLGIEIGVDFIEEVEGSGITLLNCEDEGESTQTCHMLA
jgi:hypothetical protein